jgi:polysaccharide deacetylase family protein (PEP-CTERM system associated)
MGKKYPDMINALVFDIDDLAYSLNEVKGTRLPNRYLVEQETYALLESLEALSLKATMFIPGYVAQRFPGLVREIDRAGHEIGSHGFKHWVAGRLRRDGFHEDASAAKKILEDILSKEIDTFRAPDWGITAETLWAYDELISLGYRVDNSAQPLLLKSLGRAPEDMTPFTYPGGLTVIPVTSYRLWGKVFPFNGGLFCSYVPIGLQIKHYRQLNHQGIPINYYCHPYEFCPQEINRQAWKYGSMRAAFYGIHFGRYRKTISRLAKVFKFAPLKTAYRRFLPQANQNSPSPSENSS